MSSDWFSTSENYDYFLQVLKYNVIDSLIDQNLDGYVIA